MGSKIVLQENRLLSEVSTFNIGGSARYFVEAHSVTDLQQALQHCAQHKLDYLIIGKGSNCLFDDKGFDGVIILNKIDFCEQKVPGIYYVGAGYSFSLLGAQTARQGWKGLEFASGIPGSVGGAVYMNAGAGGSDTSESLVAVNYLTAKGEEVVFSRDKLTFSYRTSSFQSMCGAIVAATFRLEGCSSARKKQLELVNYRTKTQPYHQPSAGCVFRNPMGGSAGALIEQAGLKGKSVGGAKVSEQHANFIVNNGGATAEDVLKLMAFVRENVKKKFGINLEAEVRVIPFKRSVSHVA